MSMSFTKFFVKTSFFLTLFCVSFLANSQDGKIVERKQVKWQDYDDLAFKISENGKLHPQYSYIDSVLVEEIFYLSDGLRVKGYLAQPKYDGKFPCVIYNRGGNNEFGKLNVWKAFFILGKTASWGYVVAGSQYRGNDGGEGKEEFGGADVNDILNLVPLFKNLKNADVSNLGLYGWSRGGMMTYLALTKTNVFKAAIVGGAASDLRMVMDTRLDTFETVYIENIPGYEEHKAESLNSRSAIHRVEDICKTTPVLMLHGTADWRVVPQMALELSAAFIKEGVPHRLVLFEGGDHGLREFNDEVDFMVKNWLDKYLKNNHSLPDLVPHGR